MTTEELLKQQDELQKEGNEVINELGLIELLSKYGPLDIGGSIKTGLMVWRDIDIGVINLISKKDLWIIADVLLSKPYLKKIELLDNVKNENPKYPKGYYIGIKYRKNENVWKIDLWFADDFQEHGNFDDWLIPKLNNELRKTILNIKFQVHENPKYRKDFFSVDIYRAVVENGIGDLEGFEKYLEKTGRSLD